MTDTRNIQNPKQQGTALISVLLILVIAVFLTTQMAERQHIDIRRTVNMITADQAYQYAIAAEELAISVLKEDMDKDIEDNRLTDHLKEKWHGQTFFPVEGGGITASMKDLQGRFNLNELKGPNAADAKNQFLQLLQSLGIPSDGEVQAINIADAVFDWMDDDNIPIGQGVEDYYYQGLERPYRTSNEQFRSVTELRLIKGVTDKDFEALLPFITVLPPGRPVNVNTVSQEVLSTLISSADAVQVIEGRGEKGYASVDDAFAFMQQKPQNYQSRFSVGSKFFELQATARIEGRTARLRSVIYRPPELNEENRFRVILRDQGRKFRFYESLNSEQET